MPDPATLREAAAELRAGMAVRDTTPVTAPEGKARVHRAGQLRVGMVI